MKRNGFGLVEILISSALLMFLIGGTAQLLVVSLRAKANADFAFAAARCASARLERYKSIPFDSPELRPGVSSPAVEDAAFRAGLESELRVEELTPAAKKIVLVISGRNFPLKEQTYCLLLVRELGF